jgi:hypothetical protein
MKIADIVEKLKEKGATVDMKMNRITGDAFCVVTIPLDLVLYGAELEDDLTSSNE